MILTISGSGAGELAYSFLITLREGLEAALIIGILLAYLTKVNRKEGFRPMLLGVGGALLLSLAGGVAIRLLTEGLSGAAMEIFEGSMMLLAAGILTYMVLWMQRQSRGIKAELHGQMDVALSRGSSWALSLLAFTVVVREGLETVLFLSAGAATADVPATYLLGALAGGALATVLGVLLYRGSLRLDLRVFFTVTGWALIIFAAGMLANGFKELHEAGLVPRVVAHVWDTYDWLPDTTTFGRIMAALFGYDASPSLMQVTAYFGYLVAAGGFFWLGSRSRAART